MRFSLTQLLLIVPAFLLTMHIAPPGMPRDRGCGVFTPLRDVRAIGDAILHADSANEIPEDVLNDWLADRLPADYPVKTQLSQHPGVDAWGNTYRVVRDVTSDDGGLVPVGVYSMGLDGESATEGNDADDVSSWSDRSPGYYDVLHKGDRKQRHRAQVAVHAALWTPVTYAVLFGIVWLFHRAARPAYAGVTLADSTPTKLASVEREVAH